MNYLFSGENSVLKNFIPPSYQTYIATAINIAPLILATLSGLLAIATVQMFQSSNTKIVSSNDGGTNTDTDSAISFLLGVLFAAELGTRLFAVVAFKQQLKLAGNLMPVEARTLFLQIANKMESKDNTISAEGVDFKEPNVSSFLSALYSTAGMNTIKNETHLRWVLFDLTVFYHVIIRAYAIADQNLEDLDIFTLIFSRSYMHFFVIMMMFSTSESIHAIYHVDHISVLFPVSAKNMFACTDKLLNQSEKKCISLDLFHKPEPRSRNNTKSLFDNKSSFA